MKLITFQHKDIIKDLNSKGIYECRLKSSFSKATPDCYKMLANRLNLTENVYPIFAWYNVLGLPLVVNIDTINRAMEMTGFKIDEYYLFELEVPDEFVDLQYFFNFVDMRCVEEFNDNVFTTWKDVFNVDKTESRIEIQATLPNIRKEWIMNVYEMTEEDVPINLGSKINLEYLKKNNLEIPETITRKEVTKINKIYLDNMNVF